jgi:hypothetical protein
MASGILPGCRQKLRTEAVGGVQAALPDWPEERKQADPANGLLERFKGQSRAGIAWDIDPRPAPVSEAEARAAAALPGDVVRTQVAGHAAILLRGSTLVWRCDSSHRLFRLWSQGPASPDVANLAAHVRCHSERMLTNGDVPAAAASVLGAEWRFASRGRGSISWMRDDAVLTYFAGQSVPGPRDPEAAREAAPAWVAAAGLSEPVASASELSPGPQGHPALKVKGVARLDGRPVRWTLLFWRCLQRQRSFAAVVFARTPSDERKEDAALLSARCHG